MFPYQYCRKIVSTMQAFGCKLLFRHDSTNGSKGKNFNAS